MAMQPQCVKLVQAAAAKAGRKPLTKGELQKIDDDMSATLRQLARTDPNWQSMARDQRLTAAGEKLIAEIEADAKRVKENALRQIVAQTQVANSIATIQANSKGASLTDATKRHMANTHNIIRQIRSSAVAGLMDTIEALGDKTGAGVGRRLLMTVFDAENPIMTKDLIREIYKGADGHTGNKAAQAGAKAWLDTIEKMRTRFNAAGGDVGKLDYGYVPRNWDASKVRKAGADKWAADMLPEVDRARMLHEDGSRMSDAEVTDFLRAAWNTVSQSGVNKQEPGAYQGSGKRANRGQEHRLIHFKDGDADLRIRAKYAQASVFDAMSSHIGGISRDIGLVERYGPDPNGTAKLRFDLIAQQAGKELNEAIGPMEIDPRTYWNMLSGKTSTPVNERLANVGTTVRNINVFGKLGFAVVSSITDLATVPLITGYNRMSYWNLIANMARNASPDFFGGKQVRDFLNVHCIVAESLANGLERWSGDYLGHNWSGKLANATMKLTLLNWWTNSLRQGFNMALSNKLAEMAKKPWAALEEFDRKRLQRAGITDADWGVLQGTVPAKYKGGEYLTPADVSAVSDIDVQRIRDSEMQAIKDRISAQTTELADRNAKEAQWITGRIDKFDDARDALNRAVKKRAASRDAKAQDDAGPLLERMALMEAQREAAKLQTDMEADFNKYATQDEVRAFLNAVEDGASADKTARGQAAGAVRSGLGAAEAAGRRYGEAKGRLERRMKEMEDRIVEMDAKAKTATNEDAKAAQKKADAMLADLRDFIKRSQERQSRRQAVIAKLHAEELPRLTAEAQRIRNEVADKLGSFIMDEGEYAVVNPDLATRAIVTHGGQQAGTPSGEIARTVMQFKSFPIALISRHWGRMLEGASGASGAPMLANRAAYGFALLASLTALGAIAAQTKQVLQGKDPIDMTGDHAGRFWAKAIAQGGGFGILGDLFLIDPQGSVGGTATTAIKNLAGPTVGTAAEVVLQDVTENIWQAAEGKDTHAAAEITRTALGITPGVGVWWVKPFLEHGLTHAMQENLSPGYLAKMKERARKDWSQRYWWAPGKAEPDRAPNLPAAVGQ